MMALKHGIRGFLRGGWTSLVIALLFFVSALAVMISTLVLDVCDIYRSKTEDPYSDYFRLVVDQEGAVMAVDAGSRDYTRGPGISTIPSFFYDITDYTAVVRNRYKTDMTPYTMPWTEDRDGAWFTFFGITSCSELPEFIRGEYVIASGRALERADRDREAYVCVIDRSLAEVNGLGIGDSISIPNVRDYIKDDCDWDGKLTVVGLFDINTYQANTEKSSYDYAANKVYIPLSVMRRLSDYGTVYNFQVKLTDDSLADDIEDAIYRYGLAGGYPVMLVKVSDLFASDNRGVRSLERVFEIMRLVFSCVVVLSAAIVAISVVHSQKKQLGIFLALGHGRVATSAMVTAELLLSVIIGAAAAMGIMLWLGADAANLLLMNALKNISADALSVTTSDGILSSAQISGFFTSLIDRGFVVHTCMGSLAVFIPAAVVAVLAALCGVMRINVLQLLTREEGR